MFSNYKEKGITNSQYIVVSTNQPINMTSQTSYTIFVQVLHMLPKFGEISALLEQVHCYNIAMVWQHVTGWNFIHQRIKVHMAQSLHPCIANKKKKEFEQYYYFDVTTLSEPHLRYCAVYTSRMLSIEVSMSKSDLSYTSVRPITLWQLIVARQSCQVLMCTEEFCV